MNARTDVLTAAAAYLAPVYTLGWIMGPVRELVLVPRCGRAAATAGEAAVMAVATYASARAATRRLGDDVPVAARLAVGALAFAMLCPLELAGARVVRRLSLSEYLATFGTPAGAISAAAFGWFALAPALAGHSAAAMPRSGRATRAERSGPLPGDDMIPSPIGSLTNAITIARSRGAVWPWLVQMGSGRAGWYSYDSIDNGGRPSAQRILPELQHLKVGMLFPWLPGATDGFTVLHVDPERCLVLGWVPSAGGPPKVTWAFVLEDAGAGNTRLLVRARGGTGYTYLGMPPLVGRLVVPLLHAIMQRKQLLTIAERVERRRE